MPSEFSSNIREIAAEIKLYEKSTATAIRKAARIAVTKAVSETTEAIKQKAEEEGLHDAAKYTRFRLSFSVRSGGGRIELLNRLVPYNVALDSGSKGSGNAYNRHPVFGGPGTKRPNAPRVNQPTKPYFRKTIKARERVNEKELIAAVDVAIRAVGWRGI